LVAFVIVFVLAAAMALKSVEGPKEAVLGAVFALKEGESALVRGEGATLSFDRVVEDSRCPSGMQCFWAGRAIAQVTFKKDKDSESGFNMTLGEGEQLAGYAIDFTGLQPPASAQTNQSSPAYSGEFRVSRMAG